MTFQLKKKKKKRLSNSLVTSFTEAARARVYTYRRNCIYPESYLRWAKSHWGILRAGSDLGIACAPTFSSSSNLSPPTAEPARIQAGRMQMHRWHFYARTVYTAKHPLASFGIFIISPTSFSYTPNAWRATVILHRARVRNFARIFLFLPFFLSSSPLLSLVLFFRKNEQQCNVLRGPRNETRSGEREREREIVATSSRKEEKIRTSAERENETVLEISDKTKLNYTRLFLYIHWKRWFSIFYN